MSTPRLLTAVVRACADVTGARDGWLLARRDGHLEVVATVGDAASSVAGMTAPLDAGAAGFAASSGQPVARQPREGDPMLTEGVLGALGRAVRSLLTVPCDDGDDVTGVLELVDKYDGGFSVDDLEVVSALATIAGIALADARDDRPPPTDELGRRLHRLAESDPARHEAVTAAIVTLLGP